MSVLTFEAKQLFSAAFSLEVRFETLARVTALFGPSGSGKTSVVEMIAGLRSPGWGHISVGDETLFDSVTVVNVAAEARGVGVVFQDLLLFPHKNVVQNLKYGRRRSQSVGPEVHFDHVVEVLELDDVLRQPVRALSGGERQRVALGRALLSRPRMLLMDEPLTALDDRLKLRILMYIERIVDEWAMPVLFVSHSQAEVRRLAEHVVVLDRGRVVAEGPPSQALATPGAMAMKNAAGPTNLLRVIGVHIAGGKRVGMVGQQQIQLPDTDTPPRDEVYAQISPDSILLSKGDLSGVSARNHLRGVVREIVSVGGACFVAVDVGQILWAEVTPAAVAELSLKKDADVYCVVKTHSLRVLE